jgi:ParB-like chromosome segregation protein Spo0J
MGAEGLKPIDAQLGDLDGARLPTHHGPVGLGRFDWTYLNNTAGNGSRRTAATWAPAKPRPDESLIQALAHRWKRMLEEGKFRSAAEIAEAEGVTRSFVNRMLRLTLLAPEIVEAILEGRQAKRLMLEELMGSMSGAWEEQRQRFARPRSKPTNCLKDDPRSQRLTLGRQEGSVTG